jgi:hypothetical protein
MRLLREKNVESRTDDIVNLIKKILRLLEECEMICVIRRKCYSVFMNGQPVELPIDGVLDLHGFSPREIHELIPDYLAACLEKGICQVRIIHGKGKGILRSRVHSLLKKQKAVESFGLAGEEAGGWGATIVHLRPQSE